MAHYVVRPWTLWTLTHLFPNLSTTWVRCRTTRVILDVGGPGRRLFALKQRRTRWKTYGPFRVFSVTTKLLYLARLLTVTILLVASRLLPLTIGTPMVLPIRWTTL